MAAPTIQGVNYKFFATTLLDTSRSIVPFDFGGKALTEMTIVVDSTLAAAAIYLPEIISSSIPAPYNFGGVYGTTIKIIATAGATNSVVINAGGFDTIGSATSITLSTDGASAIFTIVADTEWSVLKTA